MTSDVITSHALNPWKRSCGSASLRIIPSSALPGFCFRCCNRQNWYLVVNRCNGVKGFTSAGQLPIITAPENTRSLLPRSSCATSSNLLWRRRKTRKLGPGSVNLVLLRHEDAVIRPRRKVAVCSATTPELRAPDDRALLYLQRGARTDGTPASIIA